MKLVVGLGNPGQTYHRNRHNIGFLAIDAIARHFNAPAFRQKFSAELAELVVEGEKLLLLKPQTWMNLSGQSVGEAVRFFKLVSDDVIVLHDELDLKPGKVRVKTGGGTAGHNGLKSIVQHVGADFVRVRLGIGHPGHKDKVHGYVLHDFTAADARWLEPLLDALPKALPALIAGDGARFVSDIARWTAPAAPEKPAAAKVASTAHSGKDSGGGKARGVAGKAASPDRKPEALKPDAGPMAEKLARLKASLNNKNN